LDLVSRDLISRDLGSQAVPRPVGEPGTKEYFEKFAAHRAFITPHIREFAAFPRWSDRRVLELGCGIGADAVEFLRAGAEYTGVDISRAALRQARQWFKSAGVDGGLIHDDAAQLMEHVRQASFDLIYCFDALHLMTAPEAVIRHARRAIRPDGEFRLMLPASESWTDAMTEAGLEPSDLQPSASGYSRAEARALLRANDFSAMAITQEHIFPYVQDAYARGIYELQPWFAAMPGAMFRALERRFGRHMLIIARPS
jgi:SAM-dependent methyltransferase